MAIDGRIRELGHRHQILDRAIDQELARPLADSLKLKELKRKKLKLKEQIEGLKDPRAN